MRACVHWTHAHHTKRIAVNAFVEHSTPISGNVASDGVQTHFESSSLRAVLGSFAAVTSSSAGIWFGILKGVTFIAVLSNVSDSLSFS